MMKENEAKKRRDVERKKRWFTELLSPLSIKSMIEVICAQNINIKLWTYSNTEIEEEFYEILESWGNSVTNKQEAINHIEKYREAISPTSTHESYDKWKKRVEEVYQEYEGRS